MTGKLVKTVLLALLGSLLVGLAIGTALRLRMEKPVVYIGDARRSVAAPPLDVGYAGASVLDARHHEQQVRQAVQELERGVG